MAELGEAMSLAQQVLKEFDEVENKRREDQYKDVLMAFKKNFKEGNGLSLIYHKILFDDVRQRLEGDGFSVKTITFNSYGTAAYLISKKEDFVAEFENPDERL